MKKIIIFLALFTLLFPPVISLAADECASCPENNANCRLKPKCLLQTVAGKVGYETTAENVEPETLAQKIGLLFALALSFLGVIFVVLTIYAGFLWLTARGNEEQVKKAVKILKDAIWGIAIILASGIIMYYVTVLLLPASSP